MLRASDFGLGFVYFNGWFQQAWCLQKLKELSAPGSQGLGLRAWGEKGLGVRGLGFRLYGLGFRV